MGGDTLKAVQTITMRGGAGTRTRLQEQRHATDAEDPGSLKNVVEIVDVAGGRASIGWLMPVSGVLMLSVGRQVPVKSIAR